MQHFISLSVAAICILASAGKSMAQPMPGVPGQTRPTFSPYLNLARRDSSPALNYYGLVRPQIATQNNIQSLQQQFIVIQQQQQIVGQSLVNPELPITGQQTF